MLEDHESQRRELFWLAFFLAVSFRRERRRWKYYDYFGVWPVGGNEFVVSGPFVASHEWKLQQECVRPPKQVYRQRQLVLWCRSGSKISDRLQRSDSGDVAQRRGDLPICLFRFYIAEALAI